MRQIHSQSCRLRVLCGLETRIPRAYFQSGNFIFCVLLRNLALPRLAVGVGGSPWKKPADPASLLLQLLTMPLQLLLPVVAIAGNMADIKPPFRPQEALVEASWCLFCFDAPCIMACPVDDCISMVNVTDDGAPMTWSNYQDKLASGEMQPIPPHP